MADIFTSSDKPNYTPEMRQWGCASLTELKQIGIASTIHKGKNDWGFNEHEVVLNDGTVWDYIPEDGYYEYNPNKVRSVS